MSKKEKETTELTSADENLFSGLPEESLRNLPPPKTRMILLYITGQYSIKQIAKVIGVSDNTIRAWLRQDDVQNIIKELQIREYEIIDSSLKSLRMQAIETMRSLLDSPIDQVRFSSSKDILDRTGHKAITEMKVDKTVTTIEKQLAELANVTINESEVIDITDVIEQVKDD